MDTGTLVVGASAAGLATAYELERAGAPYELVEAREAVAGTWRGHYDRLHLHTPRWASALPGLAMPRAWGRYPSRDQVVRYLETYQRHLGLQPHFGEQVTRIERTDDGWLTTTTSRAWRSRNVVVATGRTRVPVRPTWPGMETYGGEVMHSGEFRNGSRWAGRPVLVVGFGNSACEQALDLVEHDAVVHLSVRSAVNVLPRDAFGVVPVLQLGIAMRYLPVGVADALAAPMVRLTVGDVSRVGLRRLPYGPNAQIRRDRHIPLLDIGTMAQIEAGRITVHGAVERFTPTGVVLADGTALDVDAVVLGTGYRPGLEDLLPEWREVCDDEGIPLASGRPTALPGLYFCGMYVSPAGMLREIGIEARRIAGYVTSP